MNCYFDSNGCLVCPEVVATAGTAAQVQTSANLGWNAGADSITQLAGDVVVSDSIDELPAGIVVGFKGSRAVNTDPATILHGLYFYAVGGAPFVEIRELGQRVGAVFAYVLGMPWQIRRVGAQVTYWLGNVMLAATPAKTLAPLIVNACLYAAGDTVP